MKQRTLFILAWVVIAMLFILGFTILAIKRKQNIEISFSIMFWGGWLSCRFRDWIIKKADLQKE